MACHQYFGCATFRNRFRWGMSATGLVLGLVLMAMSMRYTVTGVQDILDCFQNDPKVRRIVGHEDMSELTPKQKQELGRICLEDHPENAPAMASARTCFWLGVFALVAASIPFYAMCCCTKRPDAGMPGTIQVAMPAGEAAANPLHKDMGRSQGGQGEEHQALLGERE